MLPSRRRGARTCLSINQLLSTPLRLSEHRPSAAPSAARGRRASPPRHPPRQAPGGQHGSDRSPARPTAASGARGAPAAPLPRLGSAHPAPRPDRRAGPRAEAPRTSPAGVADPARPHLLEGGHQQPPPLGRVLLAEKLVEQRLRLHGAAEPGPAGQGWTPRGGRRGSAGRPSAGGLAVPRRRRRQARSGGRRRRLPHSPPPALGGRPEGRRWAAGGGGRSGVTRCGARAARGGVGRPERERHHLPALPAPALARTAGGRGARAAQRHPPRPAPCRLRLRRRLLEAFRPAPSAGRGVTRPRRPGAPCRWEVPRSSAAAAEQRGAPWAALRGRGEESGLGSASDPRGAALG